MQIFFEIHQDLPREGPGNFESTKQAYSLLHPLPQIPLILDIGCGPGMQTMDLIKLTDGKIIAIDTHQPFIDVLNKKIIEAELGSRIQARYGDMFALDFQHGAFDIIWSEGAIYIIGFEIGLQRWKPYLKKNGFMAVTEVTWLKSDLPDELRVFWEQEYPAMKDLQENLEIIDRSGYRVLDHFILPQAAWWDGYYRPLQKRIDLLTKKYSRNEAAREVLQMHQQEIELYEKYADAYGYVFYVMQAI
ncbi:class I SAM-dependent methyltransferase [candidate division KSB1 bacterium]|nr:class I SAM-dependent methyltransferase [candidate division KSB1 bacterium]